jgi:hypothetical protein
VGRLQTADPRATHALPTTAVLAICVYLPRDVFFCFFGFAGAVGFFAAPDGFGLFGDTFSSFWLRGLLAMLFYVAVGAPSTAGSQLDCAALLLLA